MTAKTPKTPPVAPPEAPAEAPAYSAEDSLNNKPVRDPPEADTEA